LTPVPTALQATTMLLSQTQILLWCIALIILEVNHLKWIWWTYWECAKCGRKHKDCGCSSKWIMFL
jgi:hypothetical protein